MVAALAARAGGGLLAYVRDRRRWPPFAAATAALVAAALLLAPAPGGRRDRPTLTFLDVGEGAATLFQVPGGPTVLIDAGPQPAGLRRSAPRRRAHRPPRALARPRRPRRRPGGRDRAACPSAAALLPRPPEPSRRSTTLAAGCEAAGAEVRRVRPPPGRGGAGLGAARAAHVGAGRRGRQPGRERLRARRRWPSSPASGCWCPATPRARCWRSSTCRLHRRRAAAPRQPRRPRRRRSWPSWAPARRHLGGPQHATVTRRRRCSACWPAPACPCARTDQRGDISRRGRVAQPAWRTADCEGSRRAA